MKISFVQSGGVAGLHRGCDLDTDQMDNSASKQLLELVQQAKIRGAKRQAVKPRPDLMQYRLKVIDESGEEEVTFDDTSVPEQAYPLVEHLQRLSKPRKPS